VSPSVQKSEGEKAAEKGKLVEHEKRRPGKRNQEAHQGSFSPEKKKKTATDGGGGNSAGKARGSAKKGGQRKILAGGLKRKNWWKL